MPILPLSRILYDDETWMIYTQPICQVLEGVSLRLCYVLVKFIKQMIRSNLRISDIYYKNFGIHEGKIVLFDYHDVDTFETSPSNFLITNMYSIFTLLGQKMQWKVRSVNLCHWEQVQTDEFGKKTLPPKFYEFLMALHQGQTTEILSTSRRLLLTLNELYKGELSYYKTLNLGDDGISLGLDLSREIYGIIFEFIKTHGITTVFNWHASTSGLGLKLAQDFPHLKFFLGCYQEELTELTQILTDSLIKNVSILRRNPGELIFQDPSRSF